jgi:hypothetical protein
MASNLIRLGQSWINPRAIKRIYVASSTPTFSNPEHSIYVEWMSNRISGSGAWFNSNTDYSQWIFQSIPEAQTELSRFVSESNASSK